MCKCFHFKSLIQLFYPDVPKRHTSCFKSDVLVGFIWLFCPDLPNRHTPCFKSDVLVGLLFTNWKKRKETGSWCMHTFATCPPCWWFHRQRPAATKWQRSPCFCHFHMLILNKSDHKLTEKLLQLFTYIYIFQILSLASIRLMMLIHSL